MLRQFFTKPLFFAAMFIGLLALSACDASRGLIDELSTSELETPTMVQVPRTLLVLPLAGASPTLGHELAKKMAWGLREAGYPAHIASVADGTSPVLTGWIEEATAGGDVIWLNFDWAVYSPSGKLAGTYRQETAVSRPGWDNVSDDTLAVIVTESIPAIHELVVGKIPLSDRVAMIPTAQTIPSFTQGGFEAETIIVSSEGLSRVTADDEAIIEQPDIMLTPTPTTNEASAIEVMSEVTLAAPVQLASPVVKIDTIAPEDLPEGTVSGKVLPSVSDIQQLPNEPDAIPEVQAVIADDPMGLDPALDEFDPGPDLLPDDVDVLTPESAALVTTAPELTLPEPIVPEPVAAPGAASEAQPEAFETPQMAQIAATVPPTSPVQIMMPQVTPGVDGLPDYAALQPGVQTAGAQNNAAVNRARAMGQPVFLVRQAIGAPGDGNLVLAQAMQQALREADAAVTGDPSVASHVVQCSVLVETPFAGRQHTRIVWTVTDILGQETGSAVQENDVPQGSLDQSWVPVAPVIASAAVRGIRKLFVNGIEQHGIGGDLLQPDLPHIQAP